MSRTRKDGTVEIVCGVTFAPLGADGENVQSKYCPLRIFNTRYSIHRQTKHLRAEQHHGERFAEEYQRKRAAGRFPLGVFSRGTLLAGSH